MGRIQKANCLFTIILLNLLLFTLQTNTLYLYRPRIKPNSSRATNLLNKLIPKSCFWKITNWSFERFFHTSSLNENRDIDKSQNLRARVADVADGCDTCGAGDLRGPHVVDPGASRTGPGWHYLCQAPHSLSLKRHSQRLIILTYILSLSYHSFSENVLFRNKPIHTCILYCFKVS